MNRRSRVVHGHHAVGTFGDDSANSPADIPDAEEVHVDPTDEPAGQCRKETRSDHEPADCRSRRRVVPRRPDHSPNDQSDSDEQDADRQQAEQELVLARPVEVGAARGVGQALDGRDRADVSVDRAARGRLVG